MVDPVQRGWQGWTLVEADWMCAGARSRFELSDPGEPGAGAGGIGEIRGKVTCPAISDIVLTSLTGSKECIYPTVYNCIGGYRGDYFGYIASLGDIPGSGRTSSNSASCGMGSIRAAVYTIMGRR